MRTCINVTLYLRLLTGLLTFLGEKRMSVLTPIVLLTSDSKCSKLNCRETPTVTLVHVQCSKYNQFFP